MIPELKVCYDFLSEHLPAAKLPKADAIFVFGHYDPRVAEKAAELYKKGKAEKLIVSGKGKKEIPGFPSEAKFYSTLIQKAGVPESALILEHKAMNTLENIRFGMTAAKKTGFVPKSLILVALPPLLRRAAATFHKQFPKIKTYKSGFDIDVSEFEKKTRRLVEEFDRFDVYFKQGDMDRVEIPFEIRSALDQLRKRA